MVFELDEICVVMIPWCSFDLLRFLYFQQLRWIDKNFPNQSVCSAHLLSVYLFLYVFKPNIKLGMMKKLRESNR